MVNIPFDQTKYILWVQGFEIKIQNKKHGIDMVGSL